MTAWQRVSRERPCPICTKSHWCLISSDGTAAICPRTPSDRRAGDAGWLHRLVVDSTTTASYRARVRRAVLDFSAQRQRAVDVNLNLAERWSASVKPDALERFADSLGVTSRSLKRLRVGWSAEHRAWTFPMVDASQRVVGIRLRGTDGRKWSVTGGREGLFVPIDLNVNAEPLLICEGPTDTAALLDLGFQAIGRPSCTGGVRHICQMAHGRHVVIVADGDPPGRRGAESLGCVLRAYCRSVRIIVPPDGIKDMRDWKRAGATGRDVDAAIERAEPRTLSIETRIS